MTPGHVALAARHYRGRTTNRTAAIVQRPKVTARGKLDAQQSSGGDDFDPVLASQETSLSCPGRMTTAHARRTLRAVIDAILVARADGFEAALDAVGLDLDARQALTDAEHDKLSDWYRDQIARVDRVLAAGDDRVH